MALWYTLSSHAASTVYQRKSRHNTLTTMYSVELCFKICCYCLPLIRGSLVGWKVPRWSGKFPFIVWKSRVRENSPISVEIPLTVTSIRSWECKERNSLLAVPFDKFLESLDVWTFHILCPKGTPDSYFTVVPILSSVLFFDAFSTFSSQQQTSRTTDTKTREPRDSNDVPKAFPRNKENRQGFLWGWTKRTRK